MKSIALFCLVSVCVLGAIEVRPSFLENARWQAFKSRFGKNYGANGASEEAYRFSVWQQNMAVIAEHNAKYEAGEVTFFLGENQFADMTNQEYRERHLMKKNAQKPFTADSIWTANNDPVPTAIDWRTKGAVTPVKDQASCGSCWAFGTVAAVEGQFFQKNGTLVSLSEQQLVDCDKAYEGCAGGDYAFAYLKKRGLEREEDYSYEAEQMTCRWKKSKAYTPVIKKIHAVKGGSEDSLTAMIAQMGPVAVSIDADLDSFQLYAGGVYKDAGCKSDEKSLDHVVTAVGYGTDAKGGDYYIIKNSWSEHWGDKGYIWMARNSGNMCGVATDVSLGTF